MLGVQKGRKGWQIYGRGTDQRPQDAQATMPGRPGSQKVKTSATVLPLILSIPTPSGHRVIPLSFEGGRELKAMHVQSLLKLTEPYLGEALHPGLRGCLTSLTVALLRRDHRQGTFMIWPSPISLAVDDDSKKDFQGHCMLSAYVCPGEPCWCLHGECLIHLCNSSL